MDNIESLSPVQRSESDGEDLRSDPEPGSIHVASPEDIRPLKFGSLIQIGEILAKYEAMPVEKESNLVFLQHLTTRRDSWFVEVGELGIVYLTNVVIGRDADLNVMFWDRRLSMDRKAAVKAIVTTAFEKFQLPRITAYVPSTSAPMPRFLRDIGFQQEGVVRRGWSNDPPIDSVLFGMLFDERPWPSPRLPALE